MQYLYERVAYLRGLCEGSGISEETKEGKIIHEIIDVLGEFADSILELSDRQDEIEEYVESVDEALFDLEEDYYDTEELDSEFIELTCPNCGEDVQIDEDILYDAESDIVCPVCEDIIVEATDENFLDEEV